MLKQHWSQNLEKRKMFGRIIFFSIQLRVVFLLPSFCFLFLSLASIQISSSLTFVLAFLFLSFGLTLHFLFIIALYISSHFCIVLFLVSTPYCAKTVSLHIPPSDRTKILSLILIYWIHLLVLLILYFLCVVCFLSNVTKSCIYD